MEKLTNCEQKEIEDMYRDTISVFISSFDNWREEILKDTNNDYLYLIMEMCEIIDNKFGTTRENYCHLIAFNNEKTIEKILTENSKEGRYRISKQLGGYHGEQKLIAKWILEKKGGCRTMSVHLTEEKAIDCWCYDHGGWSCTGVGYITLRNAILAWAANLM